MNTVSQIPRKSVTGLIKDMLDGWRRSQRWSQSTVVDSVVQAHKAIDGERVSEILFEEERQGRDITHCQRINMQKVYRWLGAGENDEDAPGNMPVNFLPSVLSALPPELRIQLANDILSPCGLVVREMHSDEQDDFDPMEHLSVFLVEFPEAKQAMMKMTTCQSTQTALDAIKELDDAVRVAKKARDSIESRLSSARGSHG